MSPSAASGRYSWAITNPSRDRDRTQDRIHAPDNAGLGGNGIYGGEMMSEQERNQYREQLRLTESDPKAREKFLAQHQEKMQARAKAQGVPFEDLAKTEEAQ